MFCVLVVDLSFTSPPVFEGANGSKESFATARAALSFNVPDYQDWS